MNNNLPIQHLTVAKVDAFMTDILSNSMLQPIDLLPIMTQLNQLYPAMKAVYNPDLCYTETVLWFIQITQKLCDHSSDSINVWTPELANMFLDEVHSLNTPYHQSIATFGSQETINTKNLNTYLTQLTTHYARLLFIRVDLKYKAEKQDLVSITKFKNHMKKLQERLANKKGCFKYLQGYAWALEQGYGKGGLHCHLLLIYDGAKRKKDWQLAKAVGGKWEDITEYKGTYFNCHDKSYVQLYINNGTYGIGMIHRNCAIEVANAITTSCYLTNPNKYHQRLKVKLPNMRTFGHGVYRNSKRRGLPRPA